MVVRMKIPTKISMMITTEFLMNSIPVQEEKQVGYPVKIMTGMEMDVEMTMKTMITIMTP